MAVQMRCGDFECGNGGTFNLKLRNHCVSAAASSALPIALAAYVVPAIVIPLPIWYQCSRTQLKHDYALSLRTWERAGGDWTVHDLTALCANIYAPQVTGLPVQSLTAAYAFLVPTPASSDARDTSSYSSSKAPASYFCRQAQCASNAPRQPSSTVLVSGTPMPPRLGIVQRVVLLLSRHIGRGNTCAA
ncbi:hypothetical protein FB451DRAFT_1415770 [Mycena latifolia]|nr:hypothetical protein FB451DRAFT_1415770 [Mycena latifolia]